MNKGVNVPKIFDSVGSYRKYNRGFSGEHKIFVKPDLRLNPSPVNTQIF